jgi:hypothetical protein
MKFLNSLRHVTSLLDDLLRLYKRRTCLCTCVFSFLNIKKTIAVGHGGWPHETAVGHDGCMAAACRLPGPATAISDRRGPRR